MSMTAVALLVLALAAGLGVGWWLPRRATRGTARQSPVLSTSGRGSGTTWRSWRKDTGTGLVVTKDGGAGYVGLIRGNSFGLRPATELQQAELTLGGVAVAGCVRNPAGKDGVAKVQAPWPIEVRPDGSVVAPGPIAVRVLLGPDAPEDFTFVLHDGAVPGDGDVLVVAYGWHLRLLRLIEGGDFLDDSQDRWLLGTAIELEKARAAARTVQAKLDAAGG